MLSATNDIDERERVLASVARHRGQLAFCRASNRCLRWGMCNDCDAADALEAAHITPYRDGTSNTVANGFLLRADIHTPLDLHLVGVNPDAYQISVSPSCATLLTARFTN